MKFPQMDCLYKNRKANNINHNHHNKVNNHNNNKLKIEIARVLQEDILVLLNLNRVKIQVILLTIVTNPCWKEIQDKALIPRTIKIKNKKLKPKEK